MGACSVSRETSSSRVREMSKHNFFFGNARAITAWRRTSTRSADGTPQHIPRSRGAELRVQELPLLSPRTSGDGNRRLRYSIGGVAGAASNNAESQRAADTLWETGSPTADKNGPCST